jgi:hypothetical protein
LAINWAVLLYIKAYILLNIGYNIGPFSFSAFYIFIILGVSQGIVVVLRVVLGFKAGVGLRLLNIYNIYIFSGSYI